MKNGPRRIDVSLHIHGASGPASAVSTTEIRRAPSPSAQPPPPCLRPQGHPPVPIVVHEFEIAPVRHRITIDEKWTKLDLVARPLVVVRAASVISADGDLASGKTDHLIVGGRGRAERPRSRGLVRLA